MEERQWPGVAPGEPTPAYVLAVKPNYARIRQNYLLIALAAAVIVLIMENVMFTVFRADPEAYGGFKSSITEYFIKYNVIPSVLNFGAVIAAWLVDSLAKRESVKNYAPVAAMVIICSVSAAAHCIYSVTLALLCLPIFMTSVLGKYRVTLGTGGLSAIGLAVAVFFRANSPYLTGDTALATEAVAAFIVLAVSAGITTVLVRLFNTQKRRLIGAIVEGQKAREEAQNASLAKSEFLTNMSHEIRTPLNAVVGMTEMIVRKSTEPEILEYAVDIQQASNLLLAIINDVLDISKIESGRVEIRETKYELGSLINDSYNMVAARIHEKGLTAAVTCDPQLPRLLYGDEYHMRQILVNLLSNAVKYTNEGGIELNVSGEENGDVLRLEVKVKDTGIGIREEDMAGLFDKFNRLELDRNRHVEGSGLGLTIAKQLVELMHGTISVESTYGVGSTFTVRVPQTVADRTPIGDIHTAYLDMHGEIEQYQQSFEAPEAQILVVDDVSVNLQVIRKLLEDTRVRIDTADSGPESLRKVREKRYDLILMDHMMPGMDGVETLRAMERLEDSKNRGVPVVMLTANAMLGAREEYLDQGFVDYLSKPVRGARLEHMILKYLPREKVYRVGEGPEAPAEVQLTAEDLRAALPELDTASGLSYCADDASFYRSMLAQFAGSGRDEKLELAFSAGDWSAYQLEAHTLKSSARMVGLPALSDEALALEQAAKAGDEAYIRTHHAQTVEHFRRTAAALRALAG